MKLVNKLFCIHIAFVTFIVILAVLIFRPSSFLAVSFAATVLVVSTIALFLFKYLISKPMSRLIFDVQEMAAGNLSKELKIKRNDEIGQLSSALNDLTSRLRTGVAIDVHKDKEIVRAKDDFVALASHQLRTPLSIVKWYIDFVLSGDAGELSKDQKTYLLEVYKANERLIELVNNLLDVSRIDLGTFSIDPEPSDVLKIAKDAVKMFEIELINKAVQLYKDFDQLPEINVDPRLMRIVFLNLLSNAVKYTPTGGSIKFSIKKSDNAIIIKVSDTGAGIPREQQPQIFTKLFRADNVRKIESLGTGLGLYIVKAIIEKSGGKIWYESPSLDLFLEREKNDPGGAIQNKNGGTTFYISMPVQGMQKKEGTKKLTSGDM